MRPFFLALPLFFAPALQAQTSNTALSLQNDFVRVAETVRPSVVTIFCEQAPGFARDEDENAAPNPDPPALDENPTSLGTGVVIDSNGLVLTNYHVVRGARLVRVLFDFDPETFERPVAKVLGFDEESDLAVLKIERRNLQAASFADSDKVKIGQFCLAIGAPFDLPQSFTAGVVSARGRHLDKKGTNGLQDYLQTDAAINPGNSGGPLLDLDGKIIGINTAILSPSRANAGIGFSVPSNTVLRLLPRLLKGEPIRRGFLGIQYTRINPQVAREFGVSGGMQIGALAQKAGKPIGPALEAGLREDDIITAINGAPALTTEFFRQTISGFSPGTLVKFSVARPSAKGVENLEISLKLGDRAEQNDATEKPKVVETKGEAPTKLGLEVNDVAKLSEAERTRWKFDAKTGGAIITKIAPGSPADEGDLKRGLRIVRVRVGGVWQLVSGASDWKRIEAAATPGLRLLLQLRDAGEISVYRVIEVPQNPAPNLAEKA